MQDTENTPKLTFCPVPMVLIADTKISANAKLVAGYIYGYERRGLECFASNEFIGRQMGLAANTVKNRLSELRNAGYLYPYEGNTNSRRLTLNLDLNRSEFDKTMTRIGHSTPTSTGTNYDLDRSHTRRVLNKGTRREVLDEETMTSIGLSSESQEKGSVRSIDNRFYTLEEVRRSEAFTPTVKSAIEKIAGKYNLARIKAPVLRDLETYEATTSPEKILNLIDAYGDNHGIDGLMKHISLELF